MSLYQESCTPKAKIVLYLVPRQSIIKFILKCKLSGNTLHLKWWQHNILTMIQKPEVKYIWNQIILFQAIRPIDCNTTAKQTVRNRQKHINTQKSHTNLFAHYKKCLTSSLGQLCQDRLNTKELLWITVSKLGKPVSIITSVSNYIYDCNQTIIILCTGHNKIWTHKYML